VIEALAMVIGLAVIFAIVVGAGLFSLALLGGIFFLILFLTKTILFAVVILIILASPFLALALLTRACQGRYVPGTNFPLGKTLAIGLVILLILAAFEMSRSMNGVHQFMDDANSMMEKCDEGGEHSTDMMLGERHYHFSCKNEKHAPQQQSM
jgi:hypothetical protein